MYLILEKLRVGLKGIALILLLGLFIRLFFVLAVMPDIHVFPDSLQYDEIAKNLLKGEGFSIGTDSYPYQHNRAPAYPSFIAIIYLFFGTDIIWVKITQSLLNTLIILPIYGLGMMIFDRRVALTASFLVAIYPFFIFFSGLLLSEILFMFFLSASLFFLYIGIKEDKNFMLTIGSLLMGLSILTRASLLLFPFFIVAWIMLEKRGNIKRTLSLCAFFVIMVVLTLLPWFMRNYSVYHSFVPVTIGSGTTLYEANNPLADGGAWL